MKKILALFMFLVMSMCIWGCASERKTGFIMDSKVDREAGCDVLMDGAIEAPMEMMPE